MAPGHANPQRRHASGLDAATRRRGRLCTCLLRLSGLADSGGSCQRCPGLVYCLVCVPSEVLLIPWKVINGRTGYRTNKTRAAWGGFASGIVVRGAKPSPSRARGCHHRSSIIGHELRVRRLQRTCRAVRSCAGVPEQVPILRILLRAGQWCRCRPAGGRAAAGIGAI